MAKIEALEVENRALRERLQELEMTLHTEFCRRETCDKLTSELLAAAKG
jgi:hypothetical protein